jgi:hypothetical protein
MEELNHDEMRHAVCMRLINATKSQYRKARESSDTRHENENNINVCRHEVDGQHVPSRKGGLEEMPTLTLDDCTLAQNPTKET